MYTIQARIIVDSVHKSKNICLAQCTHAKQHFLTVETYQPISRKLCADACKNQHCRGSVGDKDANMCM
jgi:hypothetical protein